MDVNYTGAGIFCGTITNEEFFEKYWRKRPLFIRNGARDIIGARITEQAFDDAVAAMRRDPASHVRDREGQVVFAENISRQIPALNRLAARYAALFGVSAAWFDGVRTYVADGIGSHFDHSDNIVLQQSGTKIWTLSAPGTLAKTDKARRMLNVPGVGPAPTAATGAISVELQPGDLLYIPLFWIHSGVSLHASLSISLVCPATPFQTLLLRGLQQIMTEQLLGHQPVPTLHPCLTADARERHAEMLRAASRAVLDTLSSDDLLDKLVRRQTDQLAPRRAPTRRAPASTG